MRKSFVLFIVLLVGILLALISVIFIGYRVHQRSADSLLQATDTLAADDPSIHLLDSAIFTLNDAENNFRIYTALYERKSLARFSEQLGSVLDIIDTISTTLDATYNSQQLNNLVRRRDDVSRNIARLKATADSLLVVAGNSNFADRIISKIPDYSATRVKQEKVTMDTVSATNLPKKKKGILKRLGNAVANRMDTVGTAVTILVKTPDGRVLDKSAYDSQQLKRIINEINLYYKRVIREQLSDRLRLNQEESSLAGTNMLIMSELKSLLYALRERAREEAVAERAGAREIVKASTRKMQQLAWIALALLFICTLVITRNTIINRNRNRELKAQRQEARETTRIRTEFMNNMSHEMRTPLNAVIGLSEQLLYSPLNITQKETVQHIVAAADHLLQVANDVLDFSRLEKNYISLNPQPFVLYQVFNEAVAMMRVQALKKGLVFEATFDGDKTGQVHGDLFRLKQILLNLISNAVKYTEKGTVTVKATLAGKDADNRLFRFSVIDTGEGIAKEAIPHLFDRFFQAGNQIKGAGLGLAITKRLLVLQGGDITVESEVGKGSTFSFEIPYPKVEMPLMQETPPRDVEEPTGAFMEGKYVLIADDQEMNLLLLKMILTRWKCQFDMATNGTAALELFQRNNYDFVLLDLHMPGLMGTEVMEQIRQSPDPRKASVIALALSANLSAADEEAIRQAGFNGWLLKPFREKDIYSAIMKFMNA